MTTSVSRRVEWVASSVERVREAPGAVGTSRAPVRTWPTRRRLERRRCARIRTCGGRRPRQSHGWR
ncbi:MAG: hypothetical protein VXV85_07375, partial [Candidatus Thermoplasmatota archaeon]|nr:hypothetical protein [Candidatus Thermoplasmatota archaeon]